MGDPINIIPNPSSDVTVIELATALIRVFEGLKLTAYRDSGGILTIGYGHTGPDVQEGMTITEAQARALLEKDQAHLFRMVEGKSVLEAAALVSFGYNCGAGALVKVLQGHAFMLDYIRDHKGNILPGLVARRELEETLACLGQQQQSAHEHE